MSTVTEITTEEAFKAHLSSLPPSALLVLSFYAPWAAPCKQMAVVLETLAASYPPTTPLTTSWLSINAEDLPDISESYDVTAVPFLVLIRDNAVVETVSGSDATKVRAAIERHAAPSGAPTTPPAAALPSIYSSFPANANGSTIGGGAAQAPVTSQQPAPAAQPSITIQESPEEQLSPEAQARAKEELNTRLAQLVKAAPVMLFMKGTPSAPQCGFSRQLVGLLREKGVKYGFFNILADDDVRQGLKEFADWPTYPQLWVDGELVGGLDIFKEELSNDPDFLDAYTVKPTAAA